MRIQRLGVLRRSCSANTRWSRLDVAGKQLMCDTHVSDGDGLSLRRTTVPEAPRSAHRSRQKQAEESQPWLLPGQSRCTSKRFGMTLVTPLS